MRDRGLGAMAVVLVALGAAVAPAPADPLPTNYEFVRAAAHSACSELVTGMRTHLAGGPVAVRAATQAPGNFLVENALTAALTEAGLEVKTQRDSAGPLVEFEVVDLAVAYVDAHRSKFVGKRWVEREARARLFARVVDEDGARILWADDAETRERDRVRAGDLSEVEEAQPTAYAKPVMPPGRWNKLVEPVVVTGIVVGLIVLFFSNQSTN